MKTISRHWLVNAKHLASPHCNGRPDPADISLLVIHNISLPPGQFGGSYIEDFFLGQLTATSHPFFDDIRGMQVSAHCLIKRDGSVVQFVPFDQRAWHAGVSCFNQRDKCNDFSIGIELEGTDTTPYTDEQYLALSEITEALFHTYPKLSLSSVVGHNDIAPARKTDPGEVFDWDRYRQAVRVLDRD